MQKTKFFTVIELMVVVAILAALISLLLPSFKKVLNHNDTLTCQTRIKTHYISNELYADDHGDVYVVIGSDPWAYTWYRNKSYLSYFGTQAEYIHQDSNFSCPKQANPSYRGFSYAFNWYNDSWGWSDIKNKALVRNKLETPEKKILMVDHTDWHSAIWSINPEVWLDYGEIRSNRVAYRHDYGTNASFGDGHVEHRSIENMYFGGARPQINEIWRLNGDAFYSP